MLSGPYNGAPAHVASLRVSHGVRHDVREVADRSPRSNLSCEATEDVRAIRRNATRERCPLPSQHGPARRRPSKERDRRIASSELEAGSRARSPSRERAARGRGHPARSPSAGAAWLGSCVCCSYPLYLWSENSLDQSATLCKSAVFDAEGAARRRARRPSRTRASRTQGSRTPSQSTRRPLWSGTRASPARHAAHGGRTRHRRDQAAPSPERASDPPAAGASRSRDDRRRGFSPRVALYVALSPVSASALTTRIRSTMAR
jgi:hypothetical protein